MGVVHIVAGGLEHSTDDDALVVEENEVVDERGVLEVFVGGEAVELSGVVEKDGGGEEEGEGVDRKSELQSHHCISYAVFCLKKD